MAARDDTHNRPSEQNLPHLVRAAIKRTELEFRQGRLDSRQAFAKIFDALAGSMAGAVPYEEFEAALEEGIPAQAFRAAVDAGTIRSGDVDPGQLRGSNLTASSLEALRQRYERPFEIITLCDLAKHPEKAEEFITRDLPVAEVRTELLDLMARLCEQTHIRSHVMMGTGTNWESSPIIDVTSQAPEPTPDVSESAGVMTSRPQQDRLREIYLRLDRPWDELEARLWLLGDELNLGGLIHDKALEWSERELRRLADQETAKTSQAAKIGSPTGTVIRRKPGPKPDLEAAKLIAKAIRRCPKWKAELDDFCGELDDLGVPAPQHRDGGRYLSWLRALASGAGGDRDRVIKAIEFQLKKLDRA